MSEFLTEFYETFDFDQLYDVIGGGGLSSAFASPLVIGVVAVLLAMIAVPKTRNLGSWITTRGGVVLVYSIGGVALKNSDITTPGPFMLAIFLVSGVAGYYIWVKLVMPD